MTNPHASSRPKTQLGVASLLAVAAAIGACTTDAEPSATVLSVPASGSTASEAPTSGDSAGDAEASADPAPNDETSDPAAVVDAGSPIVRTMPLSGNRLYSGTASLGQPEIIDAGVEGPGWILGAPADGDIAWFVTSASDGPFELDTTNDPATMEPVDHRQAIDPRLVPDTRVVTSNDVTVKLLDPTDRYPHGALGDTIEAATVRITTPDGTAEIALAEADVVEGNAAMVADLDNDNRPEVIVTLANASGGARLAAFGLDGQLVAESDPIGRGNRWRHQIAVGPTGPNGETELVVVRTPHIGGIVEWFQLRGDRLEVVARHPDGGGINVTSHPIRTINLDLAAVLDADGDGALELVVPSQDRTQLAVLGRTADGSELEATIDLPSEIDTNLAVVPLTGDRLALAVGLRDGTIAVWR